MSCKGRVLRLKSSMAAVRYVVYLSCIQLHHLWAHFVFSISLHPRTVDWTLWAGSSSAPTHLILFIHLGYVQCQWGSSLCCTWWLLQTSYALIGLGPSAPHACNCIKLHLAYTWIHCQRELPLLIHTHLLVVHTNSAPAARVRGTN